MQTKKIISEAMYKRYNMETCFQIFYDEKSLELLSQNYRNARALPAFIHNFLRGRNTTQRALFLKNRNAFCCLDDRSALTMPNINIERNFLAWANNPYSLKHVSSELALVSWVLHPALLRDYGWEKNDGSDALDSLEKLLAFQGCEQELQNFSYFSKRKSQKKIKKIETPELPYLASILDLKPEHLSLLRNLKEKNTKHLIENFGVNPKTDHVEMYFHFPYPDKTVTLHLHIRVNCVHHPFDMGRSFTLEEIMECLEKGDSISNLILRRNPVYQDHIEFLEGIEGIRIRKVPNPYFLESPEVENMTI